MAEHGLPKVVIYQVINLSILVGLLYFLLKNKVSQFFAQRQKSIEDAVNESKKLREEAERKNKEFSTKLANLEKDTLKTMEMIKKEGELTKEKIIIEAKRVAEVIEKEAKKSVELEIEKAKKQLYAEMLSQSLDGAKDILEKQIQSDDQQRLQKEFHGKVGAMK